MKKSTDLDKKLLLNPQEAIKLYNLSANKFYKLIKEGGSFVACYNTRKLILRAEFEEYLKQPGVMESLEKELPSRPDYLERIKAYER